MYSAAVRTYSSVAGDWSFAEVQQDGGQNGTQGYTNLHVLSHMHDATQPQAQPALHIG